MKLASGIAPVPDFLAAGITVGLGTDGCASNNDLDLLHEMDTAAKLHKVRSGDPTACTARTVVEMATIRGAEAVGLGAVIGSLEIGKAADITVLATDAPHLVPIYHPASHLVYVARGDDVREVLVAGRRLVAEGPAAKPGCRGNPPSGDGHRPKDPPFEGQLRTRQMTLAHIIRSARGERPAESGL